MAKKLTNSEILKGFIDYSKTNYPEFKNELIDKNSNKTICKKLNTVELINSFKLSDNSVFHILIKPSLSESVGDFQKYCKFFIFHKTKNGVDVILPLYSHIGNYSGILEKPPLVGYSSQIRVIKKTLKQLNKNVDKYISFSKNDAIQICKLFSSNPDKFLSDLITPNKMVLIMSFSFFDKNLSHVNLEYNSNKVFINHRFRTNTDQNEYEISSGKELFITVNVPLKIVNKKL